jgi:predicted tellurium resistance membrane protein TerC
LNFSYFAVPRHYQHRFVFWGILGMIMLRAIMIGLGITFVEKCGKRLTKIMMSVPAAHCVSSKLSARKG